MVRQPRPEGGLRVARGEVWLAALDPTIGSEIPKTLPCLVVSPPEMNDFLRTALVAPMTTRSWAAPYRIPVIFERRRGLILLDQLRTMDRLRLIRRLGVVPRETLIRTLSTLREIFEE
jgi:mRNA interferase MazF